MKHFCLVDYHSLCFPGKFLFIVFVKAVPHVIGLDGRPMPRKAIKSKQESDDKFWDFARQFFFGLWGFRQRPYPPGRPIDVAQAIGYEKLEKRYYDCKFGVHTVVWLWCQFNYKGYVMWGEQNDVQAVNQT